MLTGKKLVDTILIGVSTLISVSLAGIFYYTTMVYVKPLPNNKEEFEKMLAETKVVEKVPGVEFEKVIVNLQSKTSRLRFLETTLTLIPFKKSQVGIIEGSKEIILDSIINVVGNMDPEELNTISGKLLLEERLKKNIEKTLSPDLIKEIYFSTFVIQ
jgi:flagellar FliL protein